MSSSGQRPDDPRDAVDEELHRLLDALGRSWHDERDFVQRVETLVAAEASADRFVSAVQSRLDEPSRPTRTTPLPRRRRWTLVAAPVALIAMAAAVALWLRPPRGSSTTTAAHDLAGTAPPARLLTGTLTAGERRLRAGDTLPEGATLASDDGRACLRLGHDDQLCLERASRLRLEAGSARELRVSLEAGKVTAELSPRHRAATFTIAAAATEVAAVGTVFSVELAEDGALLIARVVQGTVGVGRRGGSVSERRTLRAHEALSSEAGSARIREQWRMSAEEERDEWSLVRSWVALRESATAEAPPAPAARRSEGKAAAGEDVPALLALVDALRARGRLRDAQGICDRLARRHPGRSDIESLAAELRRPPPPQPWNATPAVHRINAGGSAYVDPQGNLWSADAHHSGGRTGQFLEEIDATDMDPLYQSERVVFPGDQLAYHLPVADGQYVVRLHFAEIWAGTVKSHMRRFDVLVEGQTVLASYDIAAEVGPMTATVKQVITTVHDGRLDIEFHHGVENPKISAIEVFSLAPDSPAPPAPAPPTVFPPLPLAPTDALYRVNAGGREYVDPLGRRWEADSYFNDTGLGAAKYQEIAGTELDPLYQTERRAWVPPVRQPLVYRFPVPSGRYLLRLHFVELHGPAAVGSEIFDVLVEDTAVLSRLDPFAEVGMFTALVKEVEATVTDGALDLSFRPIVGRPKIAAIEILPMAAPPPAAALGGGGCSFVRP